MYEITTTQMALVTRKYQVVGVADEEKAKRIALGGSAKLLRERSEPAGDSAETVTDIVRI